MADKIEFPLNDEIYLKRAKECMESEKYQQALEIIKKINHESLEVNYLHSLILFGLEEFEEALEVQKRYKHIYIKDEKYALTYVMLLIKNQLFVEAEALIIENMKNEFSPLYSEWHLLETELNVAREHYNQEVEMKKEEVMHGLQNLENLSSSQQIKLIEQARIIELYDLQLIAQEVLTSFHLSPLNQRAFLELLIEKKDNQKYSFYWFNEMRDIVPKELTRFQNTLTVEFIIDSLSTKLDKQPQYIESIYIEIINDLLLLFPFIEEVIIEPEYWVDLYLKQFDYLHDLGINDAPMTESRKTMKDWFSKLNK